MTRKPAAASPFRALFGDDMAEPAMFRPLHRLSLKPLLDDDPSAFFDLIKTYARGAAEHEKNPTPNAPTSRAVN